MRRSTVSRPALKTGVRPYLLLLAPMKGVAALFLFCALSSIQAQDIFVSRQLKAAGARRGAHKATPESKRNDEIVKWNAEIASGFLPYHRLTLDDFPVNDKVYPKGMMLTTTFCHPDYTYGLETQNGHTIARVTQWTIRSGFVRNSSSRKSWFKEVEYGLIHEQGHLDINELHARQLARISLDKLPVGEGADAEGAVERLRQEIEAFVIERMDICFAEQDAYDKDTTNAAKGPKQKRWTAKINERLRKAGITYEVAKP